MGKGIRRHKVLFKIEIAVPQILLPKTYDFHLHHLSSIRVSRFANELFNLHQLISNDIPWLFLSTKRSIIK